MPPRDLSRRLHPAIPPARRAGSGKPPAEMLRRFRRDAMALRISLIGRDGRASDRRFAEQLDATIASLGAKLRPAEVRV